MNALLFQYEICNVSRGLSETANCAHELFRGHSHCESLWYRPAIAKVRHS